MIPYLKSVLSTLKAARIGRWMPGLIIFAAFGIWIEHQYGWLKILEAWSALNALEISLALLLLLFSYGFRAIRIFDYFTMGTGRQFRQCCRLVLLHNFLNNFLPMRSGEVAFPVLMKQYFSLPIRRTLPVLIWFRILDLYFLIMLALISILWHRLHWIGNMVFIIWMGLIPLVSAGFLPWLSRRLQKVRTPRNLLTNRLFRLIDSIPDEPQILRKSWLWTVINWSIKLLSFAWLLAAFAGIPLTTAVLGAIAGELSSVLPFHGLAGTGTYESGVLAGLLPFGVTLEQGMQAAVNLHLFILGMSFAAALMVLALGKSERHVSNVA